MKKIWMAGVCMLASTSVWAADVGVVWFDKSGMAERVLSGFQAEMTKQGNPLTVDVKAERASKDAAAQVLDEMATSTKAIVALRSSGAKLLKEKALNVPGFIGAANNPTKLGVINNLAAPEGNITGVSYYIPYKSRLEAFLKLTPSAKKFVTLVEKGHATTDIETEGMQAACAELNLTCAVEQGTFTEAFVGKMNRHKDADAFIIGSQSKVTDATATIVKSAGNKPVFALTKRPIGLGALASVAADNVKLGHYLAQSVIDVVVNGKTIAETPVKFDEEPVLYINQKTADNIGLTLSDDIKASAKLQ